MAPIVATLIAQGLGILGNAVLSKGKDVIEEKLGVDIEASLGTEEGRIRLRELELEHEEFLIEAGIREAELRLEDKKLDIQDTASARQMNSVIQESANASQLAKNAAYYLDFLIVGATILLAYLLFVKNIPEENTQLLYMAFGSLLTMCGTILNFHRGTSHSSREKDSAIKSLYGDRRN